MTQPFWEVELAKQHGKLINSAMDYSRESRTAPVFAMPPSPTAWQPPPTVRPAQTYAPASRSAPIVFSHPTVAPQSARMAPPAGQQPGTMRPPAARTAPVSGHHASHADDGLLLELGARLKSLKHPPGWLAGAAIVIAAYIGNQVRHAEVPPIKTSATNHPLVPAHAKRAKSK